MTAASTTRPLLPSASQRRQLRRRTVRHRPPPSAPSATTPNRSPVVPSGPQWSPVVPSTRLGAVSSHSCCVHFRGRTMVCLSFACELLTAILWPHTSPAAPHYAADQSTPMGTLYTLFSLHSKLSSGYGHHARSHGTRREYESPRVRLEPREALTRAYSEAALTPPPRSILRWSQPRWTA